MTDKLKKQIILNLPYLIFVYLFDKPCPMWSSFSEASAPGASRTPWQSLSKRYTNNRYGRLGSSFFFQSTVIIPHPGLWS